MPEYAVLGELKADLDERAGRLEALLEEAVKGNDGGAVDVVREKGVSSEVGEGRLRNGTGNWLLETGPPGFLFALLLAVTLAS